MNQCMVYAHVHEYHPMLSWLFCVGNLSRLQRHKKKLPHVHVHITTRLGYGRHSSCRAVVAPELIVGNVPNIPRVKAWHNIYHDFP